MNDLINTVNGLTINKKTRDEAINGLIAQYLESDNPLSIELRLKVLEDIVKGVRKDVRVKHLLADELDKYKGGYDNGDGITMKLSTRRTFDYSADSVYVDLKAKIKAREVYIKGLNSIPETGEELPFKTAEFITIKY